MPPYPSVEVSPSPSTSKNDNINNNNTNTNNTSNDVMSALSLAMANALLEGSNSVVTTVPSNIESSVSDSIPTTTSRASSNDGLSIWGSSTTSSSYDFLPLSSERNKLINVTSSSSATAIDNTHQRVVTFITPNNNNNVISTTNNNSNAIRHNNVSYLNNKQSETEFLVRKQQQQRQSSLDASSSSHQHHFNFSKYAPVSEGAGDGNNDYYARNNNLFHNNNNNKPYSPPNVSDSFSSDSSRPTSYSHDNNVNTNLEQAKDANIRLSPHGAIASDNRYHNLTTNAQTHNVSDLNRPAWNDNDDVSSSSINNKLFKEEIENDRKQQLIYDHHLHATTNASLSSSSLFENATPTTTTHSSSPHYQQRSSSSDHLNHHRPSSSSFQQHANSISMQHRGGHFQTTAPARLNVHVNEHAGNYHESNNVLSFDDACEREQRGGSPTSSRPFSYNNNFSSPHCSNQQQQVFVMALPVQQSSQEHHHPHHPPPQMFQPVQMVPVAPTSTHGAQQPTLMVPNHHHHHNHNHSMHGPFSSVENVSFDDKPSSSWTQQAAVRPKQQSLYQVQSYGVHPSSQQPQNLHHHHGLSPFNANDSTPKKKDKRNASATFRNSPNNHHHHKLKQQEIEINETVCFMNCHNKDELSYRIIPDIINNNNNTLIDNSHIGLSASTSTTSESIASLYHSAQRPHLSVLLGHVRRLSKDQVGCRLLQQSLDEDGPQAATAILREGLPFLAETMTDPFGNYLFQKILEKVNPTERLELISSVCPRLVNAALNLHGTRSVQKVVELSVDNSNGRMGSVLVYPAADVVTRALSASAARLCIDSHGNHVIQRILQKFPPQYSKFIFDAVANSVGDVARHRHGCCVIQRCLDSSKSSARSNLVKRIVDKALDLMQDAYGNYVVQYVLDVCNDEEASAVCESVVGRIALLAIQKFSSNVMEKCLERSSDWVQELYLRELSSPDKIRELMADPFGNYVVQRGLAVATHAQAIRLVETMRPHLQGMRNTAGGRRIIAKICRRFPDFDLNILNNNSVRFTPSSPSSSLSLSEHQQQQQHQMHQQQQVQYLNSPRQPLYCNHARQHNNDIVGGGGEYENSSTSSNVGMYVLNEFGG